ncbi:MAG: prepilin-type N-terminal cleavage/methylation domain-containing protein [Bacilli bacterium]|nr:prepilin-type N-terminal cleavage/methylation domain-containing protein [Bacilli bacterium]
MDLISNRKKKGFTVMELVIVMTLTVVILGIIWTMVSVNNKIISDVIIESDLQREGQAIQEQLSNIGMQATGIGPVSKNNLENMQTQTIQINSYYKSENLANPFYIIYDETNKKLYIYDYGDKINPSDVNQQLLLSNEKYKLLANNVDSLKINNQDITAVDGSTLENVNSVKFVITLSKKKNYNNDIIYQPIKVSTVFRNKNISGT